MPELPEVESLRRHLARRGVVGSTIVSVQVVRDRSIVTPDAREFELGVVGRPVCGLERRGKYLLLTLNAPTILVHLRMTGNLVLRDPGEGPMEAAKVIFTLDSGQELWFVDRRALGKLWLVDDLVPVVGTLGPEPLGPGFTAAYVAGALDKGTAVKPLLLDQTRFAGVGNIYADEALWCAKIHPLKRAKDLTKRERLVLQRCVVEVLETSLEALERYFLQGGTWEANNGRQSREEGSSGPSETIFKVPRQKGRPCRRCGSPIQYIRAGGRGTYFCSWCQR